MADIKDWIEIRTAEDFNNIRNNPNANYRQVADIDMSVYANFVPIPELNGDYDGQMFKISNLTIATASTSAPFLKNTGKIMRMFLDSAKISSNVSSGYAYSYGITGNNVGGIYNCYVSGAISSTTAARFAYVYSYGITSNGQVFNCVCSASISAACPYNQGFVWAFAIGGAAYHCAYIGKSVTSSGGSSKYQVFSDKSIRYCVSTYEPLKTSFTVEDLKSDIRSNGLMSKWLKLSDTGDILPADNVDMFMGLEKNLPIPISTEDELSSLRSPFAKNRYYRQTNDIILTKWSLGEGWEPLSRTGTVINYDGQGYSISGLYINSDKAYSSLFGYNNGLVKRVVLQDIVVIGKTYYASAIQAYGTVESCVVSGYLEFHSTYSGVFSSYSSTIKNCYSDAEVVAKASSIGALSYNSTITNCIFNGTIRDGSIMQDLNGLQPIQVGAVTNCFYNADNTSTLTGSLNGTPLPTEDLKKEGNLEGLDFNIDWNISPNRNNGFPYPMATIKYENGDGSLDNPFLLYDYFDLNRVRHFIDGYHFRLANDIEMPDTNFVTIEGLNNSVFDGGGLSIANLHTSGKGLFGSGSYNIIKNLTIVDPYVEITGEYGVILRGQSGTVINNCMFLCNDENSYVRTTGSLYGLLAYYCKEISNCIIKLNVILNAYTSGGYGLVGYYTEMNKCIVKNTILDSSRFMYLNGLTGGSSTAKDCIVYGHPNMLYGLGTNVTNSIYIGESAQYNAGSSSGCYASEGSQQKETGTKAREVKDAVMKNQYAFSLLDFDTIWETGENHPVLRDTKEIIPPALAFVNKHGLYYSDYQGNVLRYVEYGNVLAGNESDVREVFVENNTEDPVTDVTIQIMKETVREGITPTLSKVEDWAEVNDILVFDGVLKIKDTVPFYMKFKASEDVKSGGTFDMKVKAIPFLGELPTEEHSEGGSV